MVRILLAALALAACSQGDSSFRYYCTDLNTLPSTWNLTESGSCGFDGGFPLQANVTSAQSCGDGCSCAVQPWTYGSQEQDLDFTAVLHEWCQSNMSCALPDGGTAAGLAFVVKPEGNAPVRLQAALIGACELDLSGPPQ